MLQNSDDFCPTPRAGHSLLANKNVLYLYGGANHEEGILSDLYQGTLSGNKIQWKAIKLFSSSIPPGRYEHSALICNNEMVVAHGAGGDGPLGDVWVLDLEELSWRFLKTTGVKPLSSVTKSMTYFPARNRIYLYGGGKYNDLPVDDVSMYCLDLENLFWVKLSKGTGLNPGPRLGHSMNMVGSIIYLYGGLNKDKCFDDFWKYDTGTNKWECLTTTGDKPGSRCAHTATLINDDKQILLTGGMSISSGKQVVYSDIYILDLDTFVWKKSAKELDQRLLDHTCCVLDSDSIIIHGGMSFEHVFQDAQIIEIADL